MGEGKHRNPPLYRQVVLRQPGARQRSRSAAGFQQPDPARHDSEGRQEKRQRGPVPSMELRHSLHHCRHAERFSVHRPRRPPALRDDHGQRWPLFLLRLQPPHRIRRARRRPATRKFGRGVELDEIRIKRIPYLQDRRKAFAIILFPSPATRGSDWHSTRKSTNCAAKNSNRLRLSASPRTATTTTSPTRWSRSWPAIPASRQKNSSRRASTSASPAVSWPFA